MAIVEDALSRAARMAAEKAAQGTAQAVATEVAKDVAVEAAKTTATQVAKGTAQTIAQTTFKDALTLAAEKAAANTAAAAAQTGAQTVATTAAQTVVQGATQSAVQSTAANVATNAATGVAKAGIGMTVLRLLGKGTLWGITHPGRTIATGIGVAGTANVLLASTQLASDDSMINKAGDAVLHAEGRAVVAAGSAIVSGVTEAGKGVLGIPNTPAPTTTNGTGDTQQPQGGLLGMMGPEATGFLKGLMDSPWGKPLLGLALLMGGGAIVKMIAPFLGALGPMASMAGGIAAPVVGLMMIAPTIISFFKGDSNSNKFDLTSLTPPTTTPTQHKAVDEPQKGKGLEQDGAKPLTLGKLPEGGKVVTQVDPNATLPAPTIGVGNGQGRGIKG